MILFNCDYNEGAHPAVLELLSATNMEQTIGYGEDKYCEAARELIRGLCRAPAADVQFLSGGTQANLTLIAAALRPHQGVLAAGSGHINTHETGAIEATGHKVLTLPQQEGKISAAAVREYVDAHWADEAHEHIVQPGMVYISQPTELGALYSLAELTELAAACRDKGLLLYADGARMAYALGAETNDVSLADMARLTDAFYIGGTKCGALFGEAMVIGNAELQRDFRYLIKQKGGMLAKGRLLGLQFLALLQDGLYQRLGAAADALLAEIAAACVDAGIEIVVPAASNQLFILLSDAALAALGEKFSYAFWEQAGDGRSMIRLVTSWATKREDVAALCAELKALGGMSRHGN